MLKRWRSAGVTLLAMIFATQPVLGVSIDLFGVGPIPLEASAETEGIASSRLLIESHLVELGRSRFEAKRLAGLLTPDDLAVLTDNPAMMQEAGAMSAQQRNMMVGLLLLGGLIALAYAGDGSIIQN